MTRVVALKDAVRAIPNFPQAGILFQDISPILSDPGLLQAAVDELADPFMDQDITKVIGIEARGFILGAMLAHRLEAGFVPVRKENKLPAETIAVSYDLEYGVDVVEMHVDAAGRHDRILIHDDVLATGGTAAATYDLVKRTDADIVGFSFLIELDALHGRQRLDERLPIHSVLHL